MADVTIGSEGKPSHVELTGPNYDLKAEVNVHIQLSTFSPACVGRKIRISFRFQFEGEPTYDNIPPKVIYEPPLSFVIVLRPGKPIID